MRLEINGDMRVVSDEVRTVEDLVRELELVPETVLIEHNGTALHRREWKESSLKAEDQIEILRVVAGG